MSPTLSKQSLPNQTSAISGKSAHSSSTVDSIASTGDISSSNLSRHRASGRSEWLSPKTENHYLVNLGNPVLVCHLPTPFFDDALYYQESHNSASINPPRMETISSVNASGKTQRTNSTMMIKIFHCYFRKLSKDSMLL